MLQPPVFLSWGKAQPNRQNVTIHNVSSITSHAVYSGIHQSRQPFKGKTILVCISLEFLGNFFLVKGLLDSNASAERQLSPFEGEVNRHGHQRSKIGVGMKLEYFSNTEAY